MPSRLPLASQNVCCSSLAQPSLRTMSLLTWWDLLGSWLWCGQGEGHWFLCRSQIISIDRIRQNLHKMTDIKWPYSSRSYHHWWVVTGWLQELLWKEKWVTNWVGDHFLWQGFLRGGFQIRIVKSDMSKCLLTDGAQQSSLCVRWKGSDPSDTIKFTRILCTPFTWYRFWKDALTGSKSQMKNTLCSLYVSGSYSSPRGARA